MLKSCTYCGGIHKRGQRCASKPVATKQTTYIDRFRWSRAWKNKRAHIADRDKYLCQVCLRNLYNTQMQYNFTDLEVHHIEPIGDKRLEEICTWWVLLSLFFGIVIIPYSFFLTIWPDRNMRLASFFWLTFFF